MKLRLPYPTLLNRLYRHMRGRVVKAEAAKEYHKLVRLLALTQCARKPLAGDVVLTLNVFRPRNAGDVDAPLKLVLDALQGVAYADDAQVAELHVYRWKDAADPRVEVKAEAQTTGGTT